jgi:hypothetical protein
LSCVDLGKTFRQLNRKYQEEKMDSTVQEIAAVLRSTETMADQFAKRVQERVGQPVSYAQILVAMKKTPAKSLSMKKVVTKLRRQLERKKK